MNATVSLKAVVDELEGLPEGWSIYLHRRTGEFLSLSDDDLRAIESDDPDDQPDLPEEMLPLTLDDLESDDYVLLPSSFDIHEWSIMDRFCRSLADQHRREELSAAIRGAGAFRMFRDTIGRMGIEDEWYAFRREAFEAIAVEWLEEHGIAYDARESATHSERT
jgi:hypothetical protein